MTCFRKLICFVEHVPDFRDEVQRNESRILLFEIRVKNYFEDPRRRAEQKAGASRVFSVS
jgi:hypothetical protein